MSTSISGLLRNTASVVAIAAAFGPQLAHAQAVAPAVFNLNIPSQDLGSALRALGVATHQQLIFDERTVQGKRSPALIGAYSVQTAMHNLLNATPLTAYRTKSGAIAIAAAARQGEVGIIRTSSDGPIASEGPSLASASPASNIVLAQADAPPGTPATATVNGGGGAAVGNGEIVVTGSRVIKNGNNSPTPVTVVGADQLLDIKPGPIAEAIAELPVFAGSRTSLGNPGTGVTNAGAAHLNLRYLGYVRTLVLFDGHRVPPTTYDQNIDIDMIPQMLLQRVDLVTGGVSAVYGSDAVAGVVNFVTDTKFNGLKLDIEGGISQYDDDPTESVGIAVGQRLFGDKGHFEFSYQYHNDPGILNRTDRPWGQQVISEQGGGTAAAPFGLIFNTRSTTSAFGGLVSAATGAGAAFNNQYFANNGTLSPFVAGTPVPGSTGVSSGGDGSFPDGSLKAALESHQVFGRFDYDFSNNIHGYVDGTYTHNHALNEGAYNNINALSFNGQNAFLPPTYQFTGTFKLSELMRDMPRIDTNSIQDQYFIMAGLSGDVAGYKWQADVTHSRALSTTTDDSQINNQKLFAALDAVRDPSGNIVCHVTLTNPGLYNGCTPLNPFGPTAASAAALAYITQPSSFTVTNGMEDISGSITGSPFALWAGPVNMAVSGEYRYQTLSVVSNALPTQLANCTGLVITGTTTNCTATTKLWADATLANLPTVSNSVVEGAYEVDAPLLKDMFLAKDVTLNGAVRFTDYKISGSVWSWKVGGIWQVNDEWKLRATRSRDIRAPTLYDLFQPLTTTVGNVNDQLTGIQAQATTYAGGNPNLKPELANTTTAGFVYSPSWLPRFSLSMDAYYIDVSNAIVTQNGTLPGNQSICYSSGGSSSFCSLQVRPLGNFTNTTAANTATTWYSTTVNISDLVTYGADFEANYATSLFANPLTLRSLLTWQPHLTQSTPGSPILEGAGQAFASTGSGGAFAVPQLRLSVIGDYKVQNLDINVMERWRSTLYLNQTVGQFYLNQTVPSTFYTDATVTYRFNPASIGATELFVNVQNLFNVQPPPAGGSGQAGSYGTFGGFALGDDPIGRYFSIGLRIRR